MATTIQPPFKTCTQCNRDLPLTSFYKWGGKRGDALMSECKDCFKFRVSSRWPCYKKRHAELRKASRHVARERDEDSYYRELLSCSNARRSYMPVAQITDDMVQLKRLEVRLKEYVRKSREQGKKS